jgi:hypothetical protein
MAVTQVHRLLFPLNSLGTSAAVVISTTYAGFVLCLMMCNVECYVNVTYPNLTYITMIYLPLAVLTG